MSIKVIGIDNSLLKKATCSNCASILEYSLADTTIEKRTDYTGGTDSFRIIKCPNCGNIFDVKMS